MNYIRHLNAFFSYVKTDTRLTSSHVSLYMALFQSWNLNRFNNPFPITREAIMSLCAIGSKNTYHKCIKELHQFGYIFYRASADKFHKSTVHIVKFKGEDSDNEQQQLDLFSASNKDEKSTQNPSATIPNSVQLKDSVGIKIDTVSVPFLTFDSPKFDTVPVPYLGLLIKHKHINNKQEREENSLTQKIFSKNKKLQEGINAFSAPPKNGTLLPSSPSASGDFVPAKGREGLGACLPLGMVRPSIDQVQSFFTQNNYPATEAKKFYSHYQSNGWLVAGKTPMKDWQSSAHKWMLNAGKFEDKKQEPLPVIVSDIGSLYKQFLAGQNIFRQLTPDHFRELNLELTEAILSHAWQQRINQLTGSNQHSILQLLQAYQDNRENDALLINDKDNLISLAKRIAILNHFQRLKQSGTSSLSC